MDWLREQDIVFDVLPDERTLEELSTSGNELQALGCLTYLENEPRSEHIPLLDIVTSVTLTLIGVVIGAVSIEFINIQVATYIALGWFLILLGALLLVSKKNSHIRNIAAWANSWSTAIKEYRQSNPSQPSAGTSKTNPSQPSAGTSAPSDQDEG